MPTGRPQHRDDPRLRKSCQSQRSPYADSKRELFTVWPQTGTVDAFCAAVGTAEMLTGVSASLREAGSKSRIVALEPASSPTLTTGTAGPHRVEGLATGIVPPLLAADAFNEARTVDGEGARRTVLHLARQEGIFASTSSALNVSGAIRLARELGEGHTVTPATGLKYLAGDLFED
ncbi:pyridoxal-phosphate dependent enzyme [Streptomyces sp. NPDC057199]|uniref:pyridoxal-phosphate dependent enzyme n=1 Tax=Streptomyces sp. NPDC057199 TaxID=3346047 RepID=UPI0036330E19